MGSTNQTWAMMVTKIALLLLGLAIIGASSSAYSYPKITDLYFPTWRTTPREYRSAEPEEPSVSQKSSEDIRDAMNENLIKSLVEIFPERRFFCKASRPR